MARPLVIAHRGASLAEPENTLRAFRLALAQGADAVELDVQTTRDGVPVVFHDPALRRLTGASGRVATQTWRALSNFRVLGREPVPRLVDALRLLRGRAVVQIEIKPGVPVAPVVRAIRTARAAEWVILSSFSVHTLRAARRLAPTVPRVLIAGRGHAPAVLARRLATAAAGGLSLDHRALRGAAAVRYFQARGFALWCWTVNDLRAMRRLADWGADGILSDDPARLRSALARARHSPRARSHSSRSKASPKSQP